TEDERALVAERLQPLLLQQTVDVRHLLRQLFVQDYAADGRVDDLPLDLADLSVDDVLVIARAVQVEEHARVAQTNWTERFELSRFERQNHVVDVAERASLALRA